MLARVWVPGNGVIVRFGAAYCERVYRVELQALDLEIREHRRGDSHALQALFAPLRRDDDFFEDRLRRCHRTFGDGRRGARSNQRHDCRQEC